MVFESRVGRNFAVGLGARIGHEPTGKREEIEPWTDQET